MPSYKTHIIIGLLSSVALFVLFKDIGLSIIVSSLILSIIGSVLPDIDHENSKVFKAVELILKLGFSGFIVSSLYPDFFLAFVIVILWLISARKILIVFKPKHRGITHTIKGTLVFSVIILITSYILMNNIIPSLFFIVSYLSHIAAD